VIHPVAGLSWCYLGLARRLPPDVPVVGIQARGLDGDGPLPASVAAMAREYVDEIRAVWPTGPYRLLGWSFGGVVAHDMGALLAERGAEVSSLVLVDSYFGRLDGGDDAGDPAGTRYLDLPPQLGAARLARINALASHHAALLERHQPRPFPGEVVFVHATRHPAGQPDPAIWQPFVGGTYTVRPIACGHYDLMRPDHVVSVARIVTATLEGCVHE
jgi:thioesterase domain-containing protein